MKRLPRTRLLVATILGIPTLVAVIYLYSLFNTTKQLAGDSVSINGHHFSVIIARTPQEQLDGLGGYTKLASNQGMLFPLNDRYTAFWMKGMLINIDIIWIDNGKVVGIEHNVPAPEPGTPESKLPSYPAPVQRPDYVLEITANRAKQLGIRTGDEAIVKAN